MPNCFSNVIGIKEACADATSYKLFINQLWGMELHPEKFNLLPR